jgi:O-antigen/teichoic acid export membrane protein
MTKIMHLLRSDFILVLIANLFSYALTFCGSVVYVRLLGKTEFGIYSFAFGIISLFLLVNGFGAASGVLQYVSRSPSIEQQNSYLRFAFACGSGFNLLIGGLIVIYAWLVPLPIATAKPILMTMALFPIGRLYIDIFQAYLRAKQLNYLQAKFLIINNSVLLLVNILGIYCFHLYGLIFFTYLGYGLMLAYSNYKLSLPKAWGKINYNLIKIKEFISYSFFTTLANAFSGLLFVLDTIIIAYVIKDAQLLASYKVATLIPFAINFIPNIVVNYYYPQFAKAATNPQQIRYLARIVSMRLFIFSAIISIALVLIATPLIKLLFGAQYHDSVLPFQIISGGYWIIASFRSVNGNILAALGKAKLSFYLTTIILMLNIGLTYLFVIHYSIVGAACAVVLMYAFSSLIGYCSLKLVLRNLERN